MQVEHSLPLRSLVHCASPYISISCEPVLEYGTLLLKLRDVSKAMPFERTAISGTQASGTASEVTGMPMAVSGTANT